MRKRSPQSRQTPQSAVALATSQPPFFRWKNRKTLAALLLGLCALGLTIYFAFIRHSDSPHLRAAREALERRDFHQAGIELKLRLDENPDDLEALLLAAQTARREGEFHQASQHLRNYAQRNGAKEALVLEQRLTRLQVGDLNEAISLRTRCFDRPNAPETPLILEAYIEGVLKVREAAAATGVPVPMTAATADSQSILPAIDLWLRNRTSRADRAQGFFWRGRIHRAEKNQQLAAADLSQAMELDPNHFLARMLLATTLVVDSPAESLAHFRILRERFPENASVRFSMASLLRNLGHLDEAGFLLDELLAAKPNEFQFLVERGNVALDAKDFKAAEHWLRKAIAIAPNDSEVNNSLSRCLQLTGKPAEAKTYYDRFLQIEAGMTSKQMEPGKK